MAEAPKRRAGDCPVCTTPYDPQVMFSRDADSECPCTAEDLEQVARYYDRRATENRREAARIRKWAKGAPRASDGAQRG